MELRKEQQFMSEAIKLSRESVKNGGGPFGAVIVKDGKIIAKSSNSVTTDNDPTAHAEVNVIRKAAKKLQNFDLSDCEIYTSCEPCPMCLGAIYWSGIKKVYYGNTKQDAANIQFSDQFIYQELERPLEKRKVTFIPLLRKETLKAFKKWKEKEDKIEY